MKHSTEAYQLIIIKVVKNGQIEMQIFMLIFILKNVNFNKVLNSILITKRFQSQL